MVFWRKKKNTLEQAQEDLDQELLHPSGEPEIEPSTDIEDAVLDNVRSDEEQIVSAMAITPTPDEEEDFSDNKDSDNKDIEGSWLSRLSRGLGKSSSKITKGLTDIITKSKLDQEALDGLEELLIEADLGPVTAAKVIADFAKDRFGKDISQEEIREALAASIEKILDPVAKKLEVLEQKGKPFVILVCGVNGAGKTTTIGKYAQHLRKIERKSVMIAAADTFRAAAIEQLGEWAKRCKATMFSKDVGADAAAVAFEAYEAAVSQGTDVLIIDTAGRLQNKANLMEELEKIIRVLKKKDEAIPHATLLVLDSTTGQNAYSQVDKFKSMVDITGLIVTKLDGSAKGGVLVGLADKFGVPVHAVGVGEAIDDLRPFSARDYSRALIGLGV